MDGYACKECGAICDMSDGVAVRSCSHSSSIVANMNAVAYGDGGMQEGRNYTWSEAVSILATKFGWK